MESITLSTYNIRGCRDPLKRGRIRQFFKSHKVSLVNLQETHCKDIADGRNYATEWSREEPCVWRNEKIEHVSNHFTSRSRGTMTLMDNSKICIVNSKCLFEGRVTFTLLKFNDFDIEKLMMVNVYAPNEKRDRALFFKNLLHEIKEWQILHQCNEIMLTGDFNCVTDTQDKNTEGFRVEKDESAKQLVDLLNELNLVDIWRKLHPDKRQYSWRQVDTTNSKRNVAVRLDRWYISPSLIGNVEKCYIVPCAISDHLPVMLRIRSLKNVKRGKGNWKFNNSLLGCQQFNTDINNFWREWQLRKPIGEGVLEWWDEGKSQIKEIAIRVSKVRARLKNQILNVIRGEYEDALKCYDREPSTANAEKLKQTKHNVDRIEKENIKGLQVRARVQWCEKGERSDKFFFNLEKYRGKQKTVTRIRKEDGSLTENMDEILETQRLFYEKLYTESTIDEDTQQFFTDTLDKTLDDEERDTCEGLISHREASKAMKDLANNKSPGSDGLSKEFYDKFWGIIGEDLVEVFNTAYTANCLTKSQKTAILTLLYKNGEKEDVKNWRPISLLNLDFKILAKCLANRLKKCMNKLVHPDQTCGIKGRTIFENIIVAQDAIFVSNKNNKPLAIISIDQTKAFDRLNRGFMFKVLKKFGFGDSFINWIKTLYTDIESQICTNGYISKPFKLGRGVRQGCPLSPMLYTLTTEALLCAIRKSGNIKGFLGPGDIEIKVKGYADDTAIYVRDIESVQNTIDLVERFGLASESKINLKKTHILVCGPLIDQRPDNSNLNYVIDKIKVLGVWVGNTDTSDANWEPVVNKISRTLGMWSYRNLTIKGISTIVNTLALSKVWHLASVGVPPDTVCEKIEEAIDKFVWTRKTRLVKKEILHMPEHYGGINCINIRVKAKSLKVKWLLKILGERELCNALHLGKHFLQNFDKTFKGLHIITTNLKNMRNDDIPLFYQDMVNTWQALKLERKVPNARCALQEFLFANPMFSNNGETLYYLNWLQSGILKIKNIWNNGRLATVEELMRTHNIPQTARERMAAQYRILVNTLPAGLTQMLTQQNVDVMQEEFGNTCINIGELYHITKKALKSRNVYLRLMYMRLNGFRVGYKVLENAGFEGGDLNLKTLNAWWSCLMKSDLDNKTKEFQWRISHKALYTK